MLFFLCLLVMEKQHGKNLHPQPAVRTSRRGEVVEMVVPPGNHPAVPRDLDLRRTYSVRRKVSLSCLSRLSRACHGESVEGRPEDARKDGHISGRSR